MEENQNEDDRLDDQEDDHDNHRNDDDDNEGDDRQGNNNNGSADVRQELKGKAVETWNKLEAEGKISHDSIDDRAMNRLCSLGEDGAVAVLNQYSTSNGAEMDNPSRYMMGLVTRRSRLEAEGNTNAKRSDLPQTVQDKIKELEDAGRLNGDEFDLRCLGIMVEFEEETDMMSVLKKFEDSRPEDIKNSAAGYLSGIMRRLRKDLRLDEKLSKDVKQYFDEKLASSSLTESDFEPDCFSSLAKLSKTSARQAIDNFFQSDLNSVRNYTGFFIGIVRRLQGNRDRDRDYRGRRDRYRDRDRRDRRSDRDYRDRDYHRDRDYRDRDYHRDRDYRDRDYDYRDRDYRDRDRDYRDRRRDSYRY